MNEDNRGAGHQIDVSIPNYRINLGSHGVKEGYLSI